MKPTERTATLEDDKIVIAFPFDWDVVRAVKDINGRKFDDKRTVWTIPASPWHYSKVLEVLGPLGFRIDSAIATKADQKAPPPKTKYPVGLYPFQRTGVDFLYQSGGRAILADEMGLGKTVTALAYVATFSGKALVVAPANAVYKWEDEVARWMPTGTTSQVIAHGRDDIMGNIDVTIMSYAIMTNKYEELDNIPFDIVIFDESHYLKNHKAQRTRVARSLVRAGIPKVLMLSGTPFKNRPIELFSPLNMLDPAGFNNFYDYAKRYCGAEYIMGQWYFPDRVLTNESELDQRLSRILIRRTKKDPEVNLDLPDKVRAYVPVEIPNMGAYRNAVKDIRSWLKDKGREVANHKHALTRLNILRQVVGEGKVKAAIELAEEILDGDKKVVLFAHHKDVVSKLVKGLMKYGVRVIDGGTSQKERYEHNKAFQEDPKVRVIICSVAGSEAINLYAASDIIIVERQWEPATEEQMEDRLHRIGQTQKVTVWVLVAKDTVDEKLNKFVKEKRELIGRVIPQDEIIETMMEELR